MKKRIHKHALLAAILGAALCSTAPSAWAADSADNDARIHALEEQVRLLTQELHSLKQELGAPHKAAEQAAMAPSGAVSQAEPSAKTLAVIATQAGDTQEPVKVTLGPGPKIASGDMSAQIFGRIHLDAAAFNDDVADHPDGAEFRRARLGIKGKLNKDFGYKIDLGFENEKVGFKDVYLSYAGIPNVELLLGHSKPPMGFEEMSSSNDISFIERAGVTTAFVSGHQIGLAAHSGGDHWSLAGGVFNDDAGVQSSDDEALQFAARGTVAPLVADGKVLHFGGSIAHRIPDRANNSFDFDAHAENALQSLDSVSAVVNNADSATLIGLEAMAEWGPVSAQAEYYHAAVDVAGGADPDYDGYYAQVAWSLTGEHRPYKASNGTYGRIKPAHPFDPAHGEWGAWEIALRHSELDLNDQALMGGFMRNDTLGVNWYLHEHGRMMFNVVNAHTDANAVTPHDDPTIFLMRGQADF